MKSKRLTEYVGDSIVTLLVPIESWLLEDADQERVFFRKRKGAQK